VLGNNLDGGKPKADDSLEILKKLTQKFLDDLPNTELKTEALSSFELLKSKVELTGGYLAMYQLFATAIESIKGTDASQTKAAINKASQELLIQYNQLKVSLEAEDDDFLDGVTTPHSDPLFLGLLADPKVKNWTQQILSDRSPILTDDEVQKLIDAWGIAVTGFVEDARKNSSSTDPVKPGEAQTIAHFFCIHDQLEGLYSELSTSVALSS
ncbi:MAG: hypothetical protein LH702_26765, partial [Phormidesmis sp. CAN_BIN44]|nr:hypothetical protein [Phormidesmis sp. CAN_BIN44]